MICGYYKSYYILLKQNNMDLIKTYRNQNTKGFNGIIKIFREIKTILIWKIKVLYLTYFVYPYKIKKS